MSRFLGQVMPRPFMVSLAAVALIAGAFGARAQDAVKQPMPGVMQAPLEKSRAAIEECRQRRFRKDFSTYKESAQCSNPKIFAAWQEAGYPHMDLITAWLNAREAASAKVDQHAITPEEFEKQMDELTIRLTAEEHRRRSGVVVSSDSQMRLELPPAAQVVGVVTPPADDKLAAKKSAAARARAAMATPTVEPSSEPSVGSMGKLASLDTAKPGRGAGGPFVPVAPGEGSSGVYAHMASQRSEAEAQSVYRMLQGQYPTYLAGRDAVIRRVDDNQGTYYRVEVGPMTSGQVDQLCGSIKAGGGLCIPRYE
jgi:hypothetical protein